MSKPWALKKEEKAEEFWPNLCERNPQGAQKETRPRYIPKSCQNQERDPWKVQKRISQWLDSSRKHAHGHKNSLCSRCFGAWVELMQNNDWKIYGRKFILFKVVKTSQLLHGNCTRMDKIKNQGSECPRHVSRKMYMLNKLTWKSEHWLHKFVVCIKHPGGIFYGFNTNLLGLRKLKEK